MNKKILLVGTSFSAVPLLEKISNLGYNVSVCGGLENDPCHSYADNSFYIDYSNKDLLLELCKREKFDYLIPTCNDYSYMTCAYVANKLNIMNGFDNYEVSKLLHTKNSFREYTLNNNFPVPKAMKVKEYLDTNIIDIPFPLLVKPDDSFSGMGVTKVEKIEDLSEAITRAIEVSRNQEALIEEFVEGTLHSHSVFIQNGKINLDFFVDEFCTVYPYQVDSSSLTVLLNENIKNEVRKSIQRLISELGLSDGLLHTQFIVDKNKFWLIETMRRCPGDLYGALIQKSTGIDYSEYYSFPFLDRKIDMTVDNLKNKFIIRHTLSSKKKLIFQSFSHTIPSKNVNYFQLKESGQILKEAPFDKIGIVFAEFDTLDEIEKYTPLMSKFIEIQSIKGIING